MPVAAATAGIFIFFRFRNSFNLMQISIDKNQLSEN